MLEGFAELWFVDHDICAVLGGKMAYRILCLSEHELCVIVVGTYSVSSTSSIKYLLNLICLNTGPQMGVMTVKVVAFLDDVGHWAGTLRFGSLATLCSFYDRA